MKPIRTLAVVAIWASAACTTGATASDMRTGSGSAARLFQFEPRLEDGPGDLHGAAVGRISVLRAADRRVVYSEDTPLQPGCDAIPAMTLLTPHLLALCGNLGGRHYTYKVLRSAGASLDVATLDMQDGNEPLHVGSDGRVFGVVMRRDVYPQLTGPRYFPLVYRLREDGASFGFRPDFSSAAAPLYRRRYQLMKQHNNAQQEAEEMLAMLLATQDRAFVCQELAYLENMLVKGGKFQDGQAARGFLTDWAQKLPEAGYPAFNDFTCQ
ncbi:MULTISPECIES: hypothetical protein [unclassified Janthinobacterium]|uniref:hypothetical protein n=1 Tax=unclassified Janthinobacterium TaxID=2610881 RepID=UPI0012F825CE|nr:MULTISPECIES: hypothetical protein [unclassified Janthinobacterium]MEC5162996.1 hypothetical protein [Janthinobacterium sp. CG_S6]